MRSLITSVFIIIAMGLSIGMSSCSDDTTTTPTADGDIMPLKTGSYYVYNVFRIDSLTGQRDNTPFRKDSVVVGNTSTQSGKSATALTTYSTGLEPIIDFYTKEGKTILGYWKFLPPALNVSPILDSLIPQTRRWSKFADYNWPLDSNWTIADTTVTNVTVPGIQFSVSAQITMKGKRVGAPMTMTINGKAYPKTQQFTISLSINVGPGVTILGPIPQNIWIAEDVGIIAEEFPAINLPVKIPLLGVDLQFRNDGFIRELTNYSIK